jgi:hypothetical protein
MKRKFWGSVVPDVPTKASRKSVHTSNVSFAKKDVDAHIQSHSKATSISSLSQDNTTTFESPTPLSKPSEMRKMDLIDQTQSKRAWVGVVSKEHVGRGVLGGFAQVCHGKEAALKRMRAGDGFVYYSPGVSFTNRKEDKKSKTGGGESNNNTSSNKLQAFTAIGRVKDERVYQHKMDDDFIPFRRDIDYKVPCKEIQLKHIKYVM